jgi:hypothetical protein
MPCYEPFLKYDSGAARCRVRHKKLIRAVMQDYARAFVGGYLTIEFF